MNKPVFKTLLLSLAVVLSATIAPAHEQVSALHLSALPANSARFACATQEEIERGWEHQQQLLDARLAAKEPQGVRVPGAIISPPFPDFAPYRSDAPIARATRKGSKPASGANRRLTERGSSSSKS